MVYLYLFCAPPADEDLRDIENFRNLLNDDDDDSGNDGNNRSNEHGADFSFMDAHMGSDVDDLDTADGPAMDVDNPATGPHAADSKLPFPTNLADGSLGIEYHPMYVHACLSIEDMPLTQHIFPCTWQHRSWCH